MRSQSRNPRTALGSIALVLMFIGASHISAQQNAPVTTTADQMPDARFYSLVFRHLLYLQDHGPANDVQGGASPAVSSFYTDRVKATRKETSLLLAEATAWKADVTPLDSQAHNIVMAIRAKTPGGKLAPGEEPPPVPQELIELQQQRDAMTISHAAHLRETFGATRYDEIARNIRREVRLSSQKPAVNASQAAAFQAFAQSRRAK